MADGCEGTCQICGDLCAGAEAEFRRQFAVRIGDLTEEHVRLKSDLANAKIMANQLGNALNHAVGERNRLRDENRTLRLEANGATPIPMLLWCPACRARHVDEGKFATKPHHTHACQGCGHVWRTALVATVGVQFLPGFKDSVAAEVNRDQRDEGAQAQPAGAAAAPTGQAGGAQSGSAGPPAGLTCEDVGCPCARAHQPIPTLKPRPAPPRPEPPEAPPTSCACFHAPEQHWDCIGPKNWGTCRVIGCACLGFKGEEASRG